MTDNTPIPSGTAPLTNQQLAFLAGNVFTPGAPINERQLFAGRSNQLNTIMKAVSQKGYHAVLYGERGVGKTSLANVLGEYLRDLASNQIIFSRVNCDVSDSYTTLWKKVLRDITLNNQRQGIGFNADTLTQSNSALANLPETLNPDEIRRFLSSPVFNNLTIVFIFDEFDRISQPSLTALMADTIKTFSDYSISATILIIGVADSVENLIHEHKSIERALVQVPMPRMSPEEIKQIIINGLTLLTMTITDDALEEIATLSQGFPYITHLIGLHCSQNVLNQGRREVDLTDVNRAIHNALDQFQQSVKLSYYEAVNSTRANIYREVLLAAALTKTDEMGFFNAAPIRVPLSVITGKSYDTPGFANNLREFTEAERGKILEKFGESGRSRYRFASPLMRPYIIMRGFADGLLTKEKVIEINEQQASRPISESSSSSTEEGE